MTPQPPERPDLDAPEARITRDKADGMEWSYTSGEDVLELIAYARSLEARVAELEDERELAGEHYGALAYYSEQTDERLREAERLLERYGFHEGGCGVVAWISDDTPEGPYKNGAHWPSHAAMVMDPRCTCGLRAFLSREEKGG